MAANIIVTGLVFLYSGWIIKNQWKNSRAGGCGCSGCSGCCSGCTGCCPSSVKTR